MNATNNSSDIDDDTLTEELKEFESNDEEDDEYLDLTGDSWRVTDDQLADWAMRTVQFEREEFERVKEIADSQIEAINSKVEIAKKRCDRRTQFLLLRLKDYFDTVKHRETDTQSTYQLLSGKLVYKKPTTKIKKDNELCLLNYIKMSNLNEFIKTEESVKWAEYKKRLVALDGNVVDKETGDTVSGAVAVEQSGSFDIRPEKGKTDL